MKIETFASDSDGVWKRFLVYRCPGCKSRHTVVIEGPGALTWDGSYDNPSIEENLVRFGPKGSTYRCHALMRDGMLEFQADCSHVLADCTVPVPQLDEAKVAKPLFKVKI